MYAGGIGVSTVRSRCLVVPALIIIGILHLWLPVEVGWVCVVRTAIVGVAVMTGHAWWGAILELTLLLSLRGAHRCLLRGWGS